MSYEPKIKTYLIGYIIIPFQRIFCLFFQFTWLKSKQQSWQRSSEANPVSGSMDGQSQTINSEEILAHGFSQMSSTQIFSCLQIKSIYPSHQASLFIANLSLLFVGTNRFGAFSLKAQSLWVQVITGQSLHFLLVHSAPGAGVTFPSFAIISAKKINIFYWTYLD